MARRTRPSTGRGELLVRSGLVELATAAVSGWVMTVATTRPDLLRKAGVRDLHRIKQWHLDLAMLGTAAVACGAAVPELPRPLATALAVGTWTNACSFLPLAFRPEWYRTPGYRAAVAVSFLLTTVGFVGVAGTRLRSGPPGRRAPR